METSPKNNALWKNAFEGSWGHDDVVKRLSTSFLGFRDKVAQLTQQIDKSIPGLTIHDITHLDSLWEVAETIAGPVYPLNPLEAYILGGSILLHDSALCFEAYEGGAEGVRETTTWKDAYEYEIQFGGTREEKEARADFATVRLLHASQAAKLGEMSWKNPNGDPIYLIDDAHLREHYGSLIGMIASSHHWNVEEVEAKFDVRSPSSEFPKDWTVDTLKIACLLRCADAGHIDAKRAPDFLLALLKRNKVSEAHWRAQNYLGRLSTYPSDNEAIFITSTKRFLEKDATAWWVAFDAVSLLSKELVSCNNVLGRANRNTAPKFEAKRVLGADSPLALSEYVETEGWEPVDAQIHVNNIENLVHKLGGEKLYGKTGKLAIIIRELIQNARDSVKAREALEANHEGKICLTLTHEPDHNRYRLKVDDNGIGMSTRVMLGPLLDFGTSFWASSLVNSEFPGLKSKGYKSIGRFGIGFFSIFMIAETATVFSRAYKKGSDDTRKLHFPDGLSFRPTFSKNTPVDLTSAFTTRIEITFPDSKIPDVNRVEILQNISGGSNFHVPFDRYIGCIVGGLDVPIDLILDNDKYRVHNNFPPEKENYVDWLNQISFSDIRKIPDIENALENAVNRLRSIKSEDGCIGLAALSIHSTNGYDYLTAQSVGGMIRPDNRGNASNFVGMMDFDPDTLQRTATNNRANKQVLKSWMDEQIKIINNSVTNHISKQISCYSAAGLGFDPFPLFDSFLVINGNNYEILTKTNLLASITSKPLVFLLSPHGLNHIDSYHNSSAIPGKLVFKPIRNSAFLDAHMHKGVPTKLTSVMNCIHRTLKEMNANPVWSEPSSYKQGQFGRRNGIELKVGG